MQEMQVRSLGGEDPLEKEMTTHSSVLAWEIPWTEEPWSVRSQRVGYDLKTKQQKQQAKRPFKMGQRLESGPERTAEMNWWSFGRFILVTLTLNKI